MENYISRKLEKDIKNSLFKGKIVTIYGARQVGKTTLAEKILDFYGKDGKHYNCEILSVERGLSEIEPEKIKAFLGDYKIVVLDEAQNITDIGRILKVMVDTYPKIQIIATGSSSFDLSQKISEPMTGRVFQYVLHPLSVGEVISYGGRQLIYAKLENILRFGSYPEVFNLSEQEARERLHEITSNYLFKDVLQFEGLKKSGIIKNLLQALALQIGQEVSYSELANTLGVNRLTIQKYMDVLEQSFVIFKLNAFSTNKRKEISKSIKVYFCDLGIRNSLIENFNPLQIRNDAGALWENFCVIERKKKNDNERQFANLYFWRTYDQKEIDLVEEREGKLSGFEFKLKDKAVKPPKDWVDNYPNATFQTITLKNYLDFIS